MAHRASLTALAVAALLVFAVPARAGVVRLGAKASGTTVHVRVGDTIVVSLAANASTGYAWRVVRPGAPVLRLLSTRYAEPRRARPVLGAGGTFTARLAVRAAGRKSLRLEYRRATGASARAWHVTVVAR